MPVIAKGRSKEGGGGREEGINGEENDVVDELSGGCFEESRVSRVG